ncbi:hypothetical protein JessAGP_014 [Caulobacter phage Jess A]|nr:hypothetical protein JessAGP_014 [Caulobacter phage Jess A]WCA46423.1 hypothetical protein [Caulobacter phage RapA]
MADEEHSLFSASGESGWGVCYGKPAIEKKRKTSSSFADEGTAAHTLASWVMEDRINGGTLTAEHWRGQRIRVKNNPKPFTVGDEMIEAVDLYVDRFMAMTQAGRSVERFCEQRVHYHEHLGVPKAQAWGTADGVAIVYGAQDELQVHDLKYGRGVLVDAEDNGQLRLYALGALWQFGALGDIERVRVCIHQPRKEWFSEEVLTLEELLAWAAKPRAAAPKVLEAWAFAERFRDEQPAASDEALAEELHAKGFLKVSEKGCRFCDAKAICPAMRETVGEVLTGRAVAADFEDLTVDTPEDVKSYGGNYLANALHHAPMVEQWLSAIRAEADRRILVKGETIPGFKVVEGCKGPRKWIDAADVELFVRTKVPAAIRALFFKEALKTPTQLEKALKTSPTTWQALQDHITQSEGQKAVVPVSDARPPSTAKAVVDDFEDLTQQPEPDGVRSGSSPHPFR